MLNEVDISLLLYMKSVFINKIYIKWNCLFNIWAKSGYIIPILIALVYK